MHNYKILRDANGDIKAVGPDIDEFQFTLEEGDTIEYSEMMPDMQIAVDVPPVIITSENITVLDADALCQAMAAGEKTAEWLIAKLEL